jgi:hypothetical protein
MLQPIGLNVGNPTKIGNALVATGTGRVVPFSIICPPGAHTVKVSQVGATVLTGNFEFSSDGQITWQVLAAFDLIANKSIDIAVIPGVAYRTNVATLTTTPADIWGTLN